MSGSKAVQLLVRVALCLALVGALADRCAAQTPDFSLADKHWYETRTAHFHIYSCGNPQSVFKLAGRLEQAITLLPLQSSAEAIRLYDFYLDEKRALAKSEEESKHWRVGSRQPLSDSRITEIYEGLNAAAARMGIKGVTQRVLLDRLH